jgi:hypothetical protein
MKTFTSVDPLVFYVAGGVWAFVGLIAFGYMHKLRCEEDEGFARAGTRRRAADSTIAKRSLGPLPAQALRPARFQPRMRSP